MDVGITMLAPSDGRYMDSLRRQGIEYKPVIGSSCSTANFSKANLQQSVFASLRTCSRATLQQGERGVKQTCSKASLQQSELAVKRCCKLISQEGELAVWRMCTRP